MFGGLFVCICCIRILWRSRKDKVLRYPYRLNTSLALLFWCPISAILSTSSRLGLCSQWPRNLLPFFKVLWLLLKKLLPIQFLPVPKPLSVRTLYLHLGRYCRVATFFLALLQAIYFGFIAFAYRSTVHVATSLFQVSFSPSVFYCTRCYLSFSRFLSSFGPKSPSLTYHLRLPTHTIYSQHLSPVSCQTKTRADQKTMNQDLGVIHPSLFPQHGPGQRLISRMAFASHHLLAEPSIWLWVHTEGRIVSPVKR